MSEKPSAGGEQRYVCQSCGHSVEAAAPPQSLCPSRGQTAWAPDSGGEGTRPVESI